MEIIAMENSRLQIQNRVGHLSHRQYEAEERRPDIEGQPLAIKGEILENS